MAQSTGAGAPPEKNSDAADAAAAVELRGEGSAAVTAAEIARAWGVSRAYVGKLRKKGCPVDDLEAATTWREEHARYGVGYRSKKRAEDGEKGKNEPAEKSEPAPKPGKRPYGKDRGRQAAVERVFAPGKHDFGTMEGSLAAASEVEEEAYRLVEDAQRTKNDNLIAVRIAAYNKARSGRLEAEEWVQKILKEREQLVPMDLVHGIIRKTVVPLLNRLRSVGKRCGLKANPVNDVHATNVINAEVEDAISDVRVEFAPEGWEAEKANEKGPALCEESAGSEALRDAEGEWSI